MVKPQPILLITIFGVLSIISPPAMAKPDPQPDSPIALRTEDLQYNIQLLIKNLEQNTATPQTNSDPSKILDALLSYEHPIEAAQMIVTATKNKHIAPQGALGIKYLRTLNELSLSAISESYHNLTYPYDDQRDKLHDLIDQGAQIDTGFGIPDEKDRLALKLYIELMQHRRVELLKEALDHLIARTLLTQHRNTESNTGDIQALIEAIGLHKNAQAVETLTVQAKKWGIQLEL